MLLLLDASISLRTNKVSIYNIYLSADIWVWLTCEVDVSVGQRQQRRVQRVVAVAEDGVPLVDLLHHLQVQTVLLQRGAEPVVSMTINQQ